MFRSKAVTLLQRQTQSSNWQLNSITFFSADQLKTVCVPAGDNVLVPCPKSAAEVVKFNLLQDGEIIYSYTYNHGRNALNVTPPDTRVGVELHENVENKSLSFMLTGVNVSSHGIYRCEGIDMFPPPLVPVPSDRRILVLIEGKYS